LKRTYVMSVSVARYQKSTLVMGIVEANPGVGLPCL
jgi:hypothetical protein